MAADLTTADVYEDASLIGQDIEKIIERFGHDAVMDLMPKIIRVLEKLEIVVGEKEKDKQEIAELKLENERLYLDIKREASQRRKLDEELYQISSTGEADNLKTMLIKLQEENRKLRLEYEVSANTQPATAYISAPGDAELMHKMKETIDNQRDTIRSKNMEIDSLRKDLEAVEEQIERLTTINESVRKTLDASKARIHSLAEEKAELQTELRALRRKGDSRPESDENEEAESIEGFMDSCELQQQDSGEEGGDENEENVQNSDENTELEKPAPPKPPRIKIEPEAEANIDEFNNNENNVVDKRRRRKWAGKKTKYM
ncbi:Rab interacting lysosomal protein-like 1 [Desmophyllum pertusum]|uniref:Rab interacting lysosomal protein-like 1 n=1 Tax=Desmophyllum pertusum TaxID=174260 RepID=A0A9X0D664_9CNID|nr:Rab interacting lysosomal protein-like 1 [Desmophyllum pertusum]